MHKRGLIIVDMSVEQFAHITYRKKDVVHCILKLQSSAAGFFDLIVDSRL